MGCCESKERLKSIESLSKDLKTCIENENSSRLLTICKLFGKGNLNNYNMNNFQISFKNKRMTIPAYCIYLNKHKLIQQINEIFEIDYIYLEEVISVYECSVLHMICTNNYLELLEFYLPIYLKLDHKQPSVTSEVTIELQSQDNCKIIPTNTPVQMACLLGNIQILNHIQIYMQGREVPALLDIHFIDPNTGENCALLACRTCSLSMIKYLHTRCAADFSVLTYKNESAVQVLASSGKSKFRPELFRCLEYLIEEVKVNILHCYEETLLILENAESVAYFEKQLALRGVLTSKTEVEYHNRIIKRNSDETSNKDFVIERISHPSSIEPAAVIFSSLADVVEMLNKK